MAAKEDDVVKRPAASKGKPRKRHQEKTFLCFACGITLDDVKDKLITTLQNRYRVESPNPFDYEQKSEDDIKEAYTEVDMQVIYWGKKSSDKPSGPVTCLKDAIPDKHQEHITRIYLEGKAGSGKTFSVHMLLNQWCECHLTWPLPPEDDVLSRFELFLPVCLHSLRNCHTIRDLLKNVYGSISTEEMDYLEEFMITYQHEVLIVFDGLDEYSGNCSIVDDILFNKTLPKCVVVITSRPWRIQQMLRTGHVDRLQRIVGLSEGNAKAYAKKTFQKSLKMEEKEAEKNSEELIDQLKSRKMLELSKIPLILLFMCYLWRSDGTIPKSMAEIYTNVVKCLVGYFNASKFLKDNNPSEVRSQNIDLHSKRNIFLTLGEIAFHGLMSAKSWNELLFDEAELKRKYKANHIRDAVKMGLLTERKLFLQPQSTGRGKAKQSASTGLLGFPHKTLQEFFVAYYLTHSDVKNKIRKLIANLTDVDFAENFENTLKFLIGYCQAKEPGIGILKHLLSVSLSSKQQDVNIRDRFLRLFLLLVTEIKQKAPLIFDLETAFIWNDVSLASLPKVTRYCQETLQSVLLKMPEVDEATWDKALKSTSTCLRFSQITAKVVGNGDRNALKITVLLLKAKIVVEPYSQQHQSRKYVRICMPKLPIVAEITLKNLMLSPEVLDPLKEVPQGYTLEIESCQGLERNLDRLRHLKMSDITLNAVKLDSWRNGFEKMALAKYLQKISCVQCQRNDGKMIPMKKTSPKVWKEEYNFD